MPPQRPTREQMIADLNNSARPTREQMIAEIEANKAQEPSFLDTYGESIIRPTLQAGGAALGALIGTPFAPGAGTVLGGGAGYYGGDQAYRILKQAVQGDEAKSITGELGNAASTINEGIGYELAGAGLGKAATKAAGAIMPTLKKLSRPMWNVAPEALETYMKNPQAVNKAIDQTPYEAGKEMLSSLNKAKDKRVGELVKQQKEILSNKTGVIDVNDILNTLQKRELKIRGLGEPSIKAKRDIRKQIDVIEDYVSNPTRKGKASELSLDEANDLKREFQDLTFYQEGGIKTYRNDKVSDAFEKAARDLRIKIEKAAPDIAETNKNLKRIFDFEKKPDFRNALKPKAIESTMKNVGSPTGNKSYLQELIGDADKALGTNMLESTENQFAAKYFRDPDTFSGFVTGRSKLIPSIAASIGGAVGGVPGSFVGGAAGVAAASPAFLKSIAPKAQITQKLLQDLAKSRLTQTTAKTLPFAGGSLVKGRNK